MVTKEIQDYQGKKLPVGKGVVGAKISGADLLRVAIAAYNSGWWAYYNYSTGHDPDRFTTGHDYSADVLRRSVRFGQLLAHDAKAATPLPAPTAPPHPTILDSPFDAGPPDTVLV